MTDQLDKYIKENDIPHSKTAALIYPEVMKDLLEIHPSVITKVFDKLDTVTGGFRAREFSILCGATGVGKTCLLANLSTAFLKQKVPHFVASVETGATDFMRRIISVLEKKDLNGGDAITIDAAKRIHIAHEQIIKSDCLHLSLYDNRFKVTQLMSDIAWHVKNHGIKIAMIDNLNFFMEVTRAADQIIEMDRVIHDLIIFCKQVDVHIIMVMHPKKTDHGRVESEFDIKGSSTAVQEAHNVFLFNRAHPDAIKQGIAGPTSRELKIAKMRRKGRFAGRSLIFECTDGVSYTEGVLA